MRLHRPDTADHHDARPDGDQQPTGLSVTVDGWQRHYSSNLPVDLGFEHTITTTDAAVRRGPPRVQVPALENSASPLRATVTVFDFGRLHRIFPKQYR